MTSKFNLTTQAPQASFRRKTNVRFPSNYSLNARLSTRDLDIDVQDLQDIGSPNSELKDSLVNVVYVPDEDDPEELVPKYVGLGDQSVQADEVTNVVDEILAKEDALNPGISIVDETVATVLSVAAKMKPQRSPTPPENKMLPSKGADSKTLVKSSTMGTEVSANLNSGGGGSPVSRKPDTKSEGDNDEAEEKIANQAVDSDPGTSRGKKNWAKLRVANKVNAALKAVSKDQKLYGVDVEDDNVDWKSIHAQDLSNIPKYIIMPNSPRKLSWDLYMGFLLIYVAAFVPYRVAFMSELSSEMNVVEIIVDTSFGVDIVANFLTAYTDAEGLYVSSRNQQFFFWFLCCVCNRKVNGTTITNAFFFRFTI